MKRLTAALILIGALGWSAQAQPRKPQDISLTGMEVSRGIRGSLLLVGRAGGQLPGSFEISIQYNPATRQVLGGTWKLTLTQRGGGARSKAGGALYGTVGGGAVELNGQGKVASLRGVKFNLRRGAGRYSGVRGSVGEADGTIGAHRQHPFVGKLRLPL